MSHPYSFNISTTINTQLGFHVICVLTARSIFVTSKHTKKLYRSVLYIVYYTLGYPDSSFLIRLSGMETLILALVVALLDTNGRINVGAFVIHQSTRSDASCVCV